MGKRKGKIQIEIDRSYEGCPFTWHMWVDNEFFKNGVEDKIGMVEEAVNKALESYTLELVKELGVIEDG